MRRLAGMIICWALVCTWTVGQETEGDEDYVQAWAPIPQVSVSVFMMKISPELAANWGLDGGPAAEPKSTPLKKDIPSLLSPDDARKVISALRRNKDSSILGSNSVVGQSGQEVWGAQVKEVMFPEAYDYEELQFDDDENEDETDGEEKVPTPKKKTKRLQTRKPYAIGDKPSIWDFSPIMGEPRSDLGLTLTASPQVAADGRTINLDLHPKLTVDKKAMPMFFMFSTFELRTQITIPDGWTMIAYSGYPAPIGDFTEHTTDDATDRRPYLMFVTAKVIEYPKPKKAK